MSVPERLRRMRGRRDAGTTLPELLIVVALMGVIAAVVGTAISVSFRVARNSEGRTNLARAEQNIDIWLPADLSSLDSRNTDLQAVNLDPTATPCGNCGSIDLSGANALQLAWSTLAPGTPPVTVTTTVQYQYIQVGEEWVVQRIECVGGRPCRVSNVLRDLPAPPDPANYATRRPVEVFDVAAPETVPDDVPIAQSVVVTVDGGGSADGAGGGRDTINLTAGGRITSEIDADEFDVPSFVRAGTRCGGPIALMVDTSNSISDSDLNNVVEPGVRAFVDAFRNTPTQVQIIEFADVARPMGSGSSWHEYTDMTDDSAVNALLSDVGNISSRRAGGATNWEEPYFRALRNADGTPATDAPNRIVMFTDGVPTVHRRMPRLDSDFPDNQFWRGGQVDFNAGKYDPSIWTAIGGSTAYNRFNQESFDRADALLDVHRGIDLIFVGVGARLQTSDNQWIQNPQAYTDPSAPASSPVSRRGSDILVELLTNSAVGSEVPAVLEGGEYSNPESANYYEQTTFDATDFAEAMRAAALKDCGGTLTIQTRLDDGSPLPAEIVYENSGYRDDNGEALDAPARIVTTSSTFKTGTFDFDIADDSDFYDVDILPQGLQTQSAYDPVGWSCRSGADARSISPIPITVVDDDGNESTSDFEGFTTRLRPNEAISCILTVRPS